MSEEFIGENGVLTEAFTEALPDMMGDNFYNDPDTKSEPTKLFENVKDVKTLVNNYANAQRTISKGEAAFAEKTKGMVKIPGEDASDEDKAAYRTARGVPESADGYKLDIPDVSDMDKASFGSIAEIVKVGALEAGLTSAEVGPVWDKVASALTKQNADIEAAGLKLMTDDIAAQKAEIGEKYPAFVDAVGRTFSKIGTDKLMGETAVETEFQKFIGENPNATQDQRDAFRKDLTTTAGEKFQGILTTFGLLQTDEAGKITGGHPAVMKAVAELAPLVLEGKSFNGPGSDGKSDPWFTDYNNVGKNKPVNV